MTFCSVVNCMDGRVQLPVIEYLQRRFRVQYVDSVTEPGPNAILARNHPAFLVESILERLRISVEKHGSVGIAVVGHHDCAGNPAPREKQWEELRQAAKLLGRHFPDQKIITLWVNEQWRVEETTD